MSNIYEPSLTLDPRLRDLLLSCPSELSSSLPEDSLVSYLLLTYLLPQNPQPVLALLQVKVALLSNSALLSLLNILYHQ